MRTCKQCGSKYIPKLVGQKVCGIPCAIQYNKEHPNFGELAAKTLETAQKRAMRALKRDGRIRLTTRSEWLKRAQKAFNAYIRERDREQGCISCQRYEAVQWHAGHYRTVKAAPELRFHPDNCHKQCSQCNDYLSGNLLAYRSNLVNKIGLERLQWLEGPHKPLKLTVEQIKAIEAEYKAKLKELQNKD